MKTVWIVLGILGAVCLLCCGGLFMFGRGLYGQVADVQNEADAYSKSVVDAVGKDWSYASFEPFFSQEWKDQVPKDEFEKVLSVIKSKLGPVKSVGEFKAVDMNVNSTTSDGTVSVISTQATGEFEKGSGTFNLQVIKRNNDWKLLAFRVDSPQLLD